MDETEGPKAETELKLGAGVRKKFNLRGQSHYLLGILGPQERSLTSNKKLSSKGHLCISD